MSSVIDSSRTVKAETTTEVIAVIVRVVVVNRICLEVNREGTKTLDNSVLLEVVVAATDVDKRVISQENVQTLKLGLKKDKMTAKVTQEKMAQIQEEKTTLDGNFQIDVAEQTFLTIKRRAENSFAKDVDDGSKGLLRETQTDLDIPDN